MNPKPTVAIRFNKDELQLVLDVLTARPYAEVAPLIGNIMSQVEAVSRAQPAEPEAAPAKARARKGA